jgi:hypothetical protein
LQTILHFALWRLRLAGATTQTTRAERDVLSRHASGRRLLVEIGVWHAVTSKRLRAAMATDGELWAVDPYFPGRLGLSFPKLIAHGELEGLENGRVCWIEAIGPDAAERWKREGRPPPEFVFLDGDHSYESTRADWEAWSGLVVPGGVIALHDSRSTPARPIDEAGSLLFTNEVVRRDPRFRLLDEVDSLTVMQRT